MLRFTGDIGRSADQRSATSPATLPSDRQDLRRLPWLRRGSRYAVEARRQGRAGQYAVADERRSEGQGSGRVGHRRCGSTGTDGTFPRLFGWNRERPARPGVARRTIPRLAHLRTPYYRPAVQTSTMSTSREWCCWVSVRRTHVVAGASAGGPLFKSLARLSLLIRLRLPRRGLDNQRAAHQVGCLLDRGSSRPAWMTC